MNRCHFRALPTPLRLQSSGANGLPGDRRSLGQGQAPELRGLQAVPATRVLEWSTGVPTLALGHTAHGMLWSGRMSLETTGWRARGSRVSLGKHRDGGADHHTPGGPAHAARFLQLQPSILDPAAPPASAFSLDRGTRPPRYRPPWRTQPTLMLSDSTVDRDADWPPRPHVMHGDIDDIGLPGLTGKEEHRFTDVSE